MHASFALPPVQAYARHSYAVSIHPMTHRLAAQVLAPMPTEALSGDMTLVTDDGHAHLVHSFLVQRLSPGILGAKIADARAQHGPGRPPVCLPAAERQMVQTEHAWQSPGGC